MDPAPALSAGGLQAQNQHTPTRWVYQAYSPNSRSLPDSVRTGSGVNTPRACRACCLRPAALWVHRRPEPQIVQFVLRTVVQSKRRPAQIRQDARPSAAPEDQRVACPWACRIAIRRLCVVVALVPVRAPLPDVTGHVGDTAPAIAGRNTADGECARLPAPVGCAPVPPVAALLGVPSISPGEPVPVAAARSILHSASVGSLRP